MLCSLLNLPVLGLAESHLWCRWSSSQFLGYVHLSLPQTSAILHTCGGWDL